ncbi:MAG TPA: AmmeMemoRadiSam system radical SAM enzyme [Bacteroidota bacterium]|nr:AmmeMemoRadiSam system radical SAM enzyme [Bacteroidota bacterium]
MNTNRRNFIKRGLSFCTAPFLLDMFDITTEHNKYFVNNESLVEAKYYNKLDNKKIQCKLCPRECTIDNFERGYCGVRENREGVYYTLVHSQAVTFHVDPVEKKPLFHFLPGEEAFSFATVGCNVECKFCQNWQISQIRPEQTKNYYISPEKIAESTKKNNCKIIAYTYSEPVIFYEYMYDTILAGNKIGLKSVMISNGFINTEPLKKLCEIISAIKIDLKAITESFYKKYVNGELKPVLNSINLIKKSNVWLEIVYLVIPTLNDSEKEFKELSKWIKQNIGTDVPIHFTRFYPQYKLMNLPPTPIKTLNLAKEISESEGLKYVYVGNVPGNPGENTYCPKCKNVLIERTGYVIRSNKIKNNHCSFCNNYIPGVFN